jgi:osmoprotectant transport system substrate-binding protein
MRKREMMRTLFAVTALVVIVLAATGCRRQTITLGSLDDAEAITVSEIYAQALEKAGYRVVRDYSRDSASLHRALLDGEIDLYAEYSGTALTGILGEDPQTDQYSVYDAAAAKYRDLGLALLEPLPANNALGLAVLQEKADALGLKTYTDLQGKAGDLILAYTGNFQTNTEGLLRLETIYGPFPFKEIKAVPNEDELHHLLHNKQLDAIVLRSNDGQLKDPQHKLLRDNFHAFIAQTLVPVVKREYIEANPKIRELLNPISASLNDKVVTELNQKVGIQKVPYPQAAKAYLKDNGFN